MSTMNLHHMCLKHCRELGSVVQMSDRFVDKSGIDLSSSTSRCSRCRCEVVEAVEVYLLLHLQNRDCPPVKVSKFTLWYSVIRIRMVHTSKLSRVSVTDLLLRRRRRIWSLFTGLCNGFRATSILTIAGEPSRRLSCNALQLNASKAAVKTAMPFIVNAIRNTEGV